MQGRRHPPGPPVVGMMHMTAHGYRSAAVMALLTSSGVPCGQAWQVTAGRPRGVRPAPTAPARARGNRLCLRQVHSMAGSGAAEVTRLLQQWQARAGDRPARRTPSSPCHRAVSGASTRWMQCVPHASQRALLGVHACEAGRGDGVWWASLCVLSLQSSRLSEASMLRSGARLACLHGQK